MEWIFSGIGTAIVSGIVGLVIGGVAGYKIGIHKKLSIKQKQKAGDGANQIQIGSNSDVW